MKILVRNKSILFTVILLMTVLLLFYKDLFNESLLLGFIGSIATVYFGLLKNNIENDRIFKELFLEFNFKI